MKNEEKESKKEQEIIKEESIVTVEKPTDKTELKKIEKPIISSSEEKPIQPITSFESKIIEYEKEKQLPPISQPQEKQTTDILTSWQAQIKELADHPLSQVKIINTEMFYNLTEILKDMNTKLSKLDEILNILKEKQKEKYSIIEKKEKLSSIKDKEFLNFFLEGEKHTAYDLAQKLGMSRSTISFRLNRLFEQGLLEKELIGKKIFFKLKKDEK
ncbi:MAG: winged helix-turn-helix domain-containing protein [Candidatus Parvarchaeota archaeon]|nr:winged helix-turn-helix domain-containing protein [Candidatus Jingweiarchaeum tengchongense]MCW1298080.1 winged helix-turn-helix domain-containing protein [Candidatus Jingweiarchaeum tengchongense]MCW1300120.1 winged helix-turn-helix domain-containing protein [Candidatus Jingweiarchaeum tengchongense]MCW1310882.1 winged helix-turn-helix domain-containing protein [Candidatus Jingweiarchaeum tengchongense]